MKRGDIIVRSAIFLGVAVLSLLYIASLWQRPIHRAYTVDLHPQLGVRLFWEPDAVVVHLDDREALVRTSELENSPIYQEAMARLPRSERPALTEVRWARVSRFWVPVTALTWWLLFRVWRPAKQYIEGGAFHDPAA